MGEALELSHEGSRRKSHAVRGADVVAETRGTIIDEVVSLLSTRGAHGALAFLNDRTRFRFTALYRIEGPVLRNIELFDRENPTLSLGGEICPVEESYCAFVAATSIAFTTTDSRNDHRLGGHAKRDCVLSYAGVPIRHPDGRISGTLCHYDVRPRLVPDGEVPLLEAAAPAFAAWLEKSSGARQDSVAGAQHRFGVGPDQEQE